MRTANFSLITLALVLLSQSTFGQSFEVKLNRDLKKTARVLESGFDQISESRKESLTEIGDFLLDRVSGTDDFSVLFVCTHNSRRSHIADTWFKFGMVYYGIGKLESFSGGLEETAFHPNAITALERAGFSVGYSKEVSNPAVSISPGNFPVWKMKSKVYTHSVNPKSNFAAIMVCSEADTSCPVVEGAAGRFALPFDDPRYYDGTPAQDGKYDETVAIVGREMLFLTDYVKKRIIQTLESN